MTGPVELTDWLWNNARSQMFSTALLPAICAAAARSLEIIQESSLPRRKLHDLSDRLRQGLKLAGFLVPAGGVGPIVPVVFREVEDTMQDRGGSWRTAGFLVASIRPPTVPRGEHPEFG